MGNSSASDTMPNFAGRVVDGRFKLLKKLGAGAYGKVYRALDLTSPPNKPVYYAVKCLVKPEPGSQQEEYQQRELALHALVADHPNIVSFHSVSYDDRFVYVVLDLCAGGDLFTAITSQGIFQYNDKLVKGTVLQLIDALEYCHRLNVFHRDIKPENILCGEDGKLRLADFGLATQNRVSGDIGCGSSFYMSPECASRDISLGRYSTRKNDIWAIGVIIVNMITGRNPWRNAKPEDNCFAAFLQDQDFLKQVLPMSAEANALIKRIFCLNPVQRVTLRELRDRVVDIKTFFMTEEELALADEKVRKIAANYIDPSAEDEESEAEEEEEVVDELVEDPLAADQGRTESGASTSSDLFDISDECHPPQPVIKIEAARDGFLRPQDIPSRVPSLADLTPDATHSRPDSVGPITPTTHAVDPDVEVPDFPDAENLGERLQFSLNLQEDRAKLSMPPVADKAEKPLSRRSRLFRRALERIGALSSGSGLA